MAQGLPCTYSYAKLGSQACVLGAWDSSNERYKMYPSENARAVELVPPKSPCVGIEPMRRRGQQISANPCDPRALATPIVRVFSRTYSPFSAVSVYKKRLYFRY